MCRCCLKLREKARIRPHLPPFARHRRRGGLPHRAPVPVPRLDRPERGGGRLVLKRKPSLTAAQAARYRSGHGQLLSPHREPTPLLLLSGGFVAACKHPPCLVRSARKRLSYPPKACPKIISAAAAVSSIGLLPAVGSTIAIATTSLRSTLVSPSSASVFGTPISARSPTTQS